MSEKFRYYVCAKFSVYLVSEFVEIKSTLDLNSVLDSVDRDKIFSESIGIVH